MCIAVAENNLSQIECFIQAGVSANETDYDGRSALHIAVCKKNLKICKKLLFFGADPY